MSIVAGVAEVGEGHRLRGLHHIGGSGALRTGPAQDLRLVGVHGGHQNGVLAGLGRGQLQALVLGLKGGDLVLSQEVQNGAAVGVLVVDNVTGAVVDRVPGVAGLGRHIIAYALNGALNAVGLGRQIVVHAVHSPLGLAAAILELIAQVADCGIHTVEAVGDSAQNVPLAALEVVQGKALVDVGAGGIALEAGAVHAVAAAKATAKAVVPAAEQAENEEQNDPAGPIAAPHTAIPIGVVGGLYRHRHDGAAVRRKTH